MAPSPPVYFQRSLAMPPVGPLSSETSPLPHRPPVPPKPLLRLHLEDLNHESTRAFLSAIDPTSLLQHATATVLEWLYQAAQASQDTSSPSSPPPWPSIRSVTLVLRPLAGVAHTTGLRIDDDHKEIHLSLEYLTHAAGAAPESSRLRHEITGVVVHEMVHVWQSYAGGSAPGGLTEGIADWVRLRAGFAPPHWKREAGADGRNWDDGYETTGWFLEWLETVRVGEGTVRRCNQMLREDTYHQNRFWRDLCGDDVDVLWKEYSTWLEKENGKAVAP